MRSDADLVDLVQRSVSQLGHDGEEERERGVSAVFGSTPRLLSSVKTTSSRRGSSSAIVNVMLGGRTHPILTNRVRRWLLLVSPRILVRVQ